MSRATTYWLVERQVNGNTVWLADDPCWSWVGTTSLAKQFPTKRAAQDAARGTDANVTEHMNVARGGV